MQPRDRIFVAIDVRTLDEAAAQMKALQGAVTHVKLGLQVATKEGWKACIEAAHDQGFKIFCDAKFKDIPNTLEGAAYAMTALGPDYFTVMADNSLEALQAIKKGVDRAVADTGVARPVVIGVTVLTSIAPDECMTIYGSPAASKVVQFAENVQRAGLDAVVCSPEEVGLLRANPALESILLITPGVRPEWAQSNDQQRSATPADAVSSGADMLVIGRPILQPPKEIGGSSEAVARIVEELEHAVL